MSYRHTPHDAAPRRWTATAWPVHPDWGDAAPAARREIAALAGALAGGAPKDAILALAQEPGPTDGETPMGDPRRRRRTKRAKARATPASASLILADAETLETDHPDILAATARAAHAALVLAPAHADETPGARDDASAALAERPADAAGARATPAAYGDIWLRDTGPVFVDSRDGPRAVAFRFNGWGGRYLYPHDDGVAEALARLADAPLDRLAMVGEPGALEFDGEETVIASRRCLLNKNRNPGLNAREVEHMLRVGLGVERVIWIEETLAGDHTDGHTDTLVRFARPGLVVTEAPAGANDANGKARDQVARVLDRARDAQGRRLDVARIAGAPVQTDAKGWPLPATHLNYVFAPKRVVAPLYADPVAGAQALAGLGDVFPERDVMGLSAAALLTGGGAFHCCTVAAPADAALRVEEAGERP